MINKRYQSAPGNVTAVNVTKTDKMGEPRFLEQVKLFLARAAHKTDVPEDLYKLIESCASVVRFNIPLRMDSGELQTVACYRAQHSVHHLPTKGGTRYSMDISLQVSTINPHSQLFPK